MVEVKSHTKKVNGKTIKVKSYARKEPPKTAGEYLKSKPKNNQIKKFIPFDDFENDYPNANWETFGNMKSLTHEQVFVNANFDYQTFNEFKNSLGKYDDDLSKVYDFADKKGWVEIGSDNSYNWDAPIDETYEIKTFYDEVNNDYKHFYFKHLGGDVRGNYEISEVTSSGDYKFDEDVMIQMTEDAVDYRVNTLNDNKIEPIDVYGSEWYGYLRDGIYATKNRDNLITTEVYERLEDSYKSKYEKLDD